MFFLYFGLFFHNSLSFTVELGECWVPRGVEVPILPNMAPTSSYVVTSYILTYLATKLLAHIFIS